LSKSVDLLGCVVDDLNRLEEHFLVLQLGGVLVCQLPKVPLETHGQDYYRFEDSNSGGGGRLCREDQ
jgi:hypothetical protein